MKEVSSDLVAYDLSMIFREKGIRHVIISPGSRNAPLSINFFEFNFFKPLVIIDERSAAYFALGMAIFLRKPVALLCTSGTAVLNYHPAIAEAYYQGVPLIAISADRPLEYIDQKQGQTIRQQGVLQHHTVFDAQLVAAPNAVERRYNQRLIHQAIYCAVHQQKPAHLNVPFYEPLYHREKKLPAVPPRNVDVLKTKSILPKAQLNKLHNVWSVVQKKMVLVGQILHPSEKLRHTLQELAQRGDTLLLCENLSNLGGLGIYQIDRFLDGLSPTTSAQLYPDLLITLGGMVVSKKIKAFLEHSPPMEHWHIGMEGELVDTFSQLTIQVPVHWEDFPFEDFAQREVLYPTYRLRFRTLNNTTVEKHHRFLEKAQFSDLKAFELILKRCASQRLAIHLANSSPVRYAQLFETTPNNWYYANRGTSGIDGCGSTAVGYALYSKIPTLLITGDIAWLYDIHAFWSEYVRSDFRCIVINNQGGGIFRIIPGPSTTRQLDSAFEAHQKQPDTKQLSESLGFEYLFADDVETLQEVLELFFEVCQKPKLLEVKTPRLENSEIFSQYCQNLKF